MTVTRLVGRVLAGSFALGVLGCAPKPQPAQPIANAPSGQTAIQDAMGRFYLSGASVSPGLYKGRPLVTFSPQKFAEFVMANPADVATDFKGTYVGIQGHYSSVIFPPKSGERWLITFPGFGGSSVEVSFESPEGDRAAHLKVGDSVTCVGEFVGLKDKHITVKGLDLTTPPWPDIGDASGSNE